MGELGHPHTIRGGAYCASGRIVGTHMIASGVYRGHPGNALCVFVGVHYACV